MLEFCFMLSVVHAERHKLAPYAECSYAKCRYAECRDGLWIQCKLIISSHRYYKACDAIQYIKIARVNPA